MTYSECRKIVLQHSNYDCECCHCGVAESIHHLFKRSTFPKLKTDPDNCIAVCNACHVEIERRERAGESLLDMLPVEKVRKICNKVGIWPDKYKEFKDGNNGD